MGEAMASEASEERIIVAMEKYMLLESSNLLVDEMFL